MAFRIGQRVVLLPNKEEGWEREEGVVLEDIGDDAYVVEVDKQYRTSPTDDGLRDGVPGEFMKAASTKHRKKQKRRKRRSR